MFGDLRYDLFLLLFLDWEVLSLVLREMTKGLQNKSLILSKNGNNELDLLVDVLCAMVSFNSFINIFSELIYFC